MLKADFHMHTHFSPDSEMVPEKLVARCLKVGLNCIAVTDHNTTEGAYAVRKIVASLPNPFMVIIAEEVGTSEGEITGLFIQETIPRGLSPLETVKRIKEQGGLVSIPHPFDRFRREVISRRALEEILPHADIVEVFNARNSLNADNRKAHEFAEQHGLLVSGVSDSHTALELGRTYVEMPEFDGTPEGFKESLAQATIVARKMNPLIHVVTRFTKMKKRFLGNRPR
ncbi:MAG: PHP domain-containing protein [Chloroflexi bacterium]|nr:PHP domain-containing protein [Chloroflexota bacterium]